ncbi:MAG: hypothetical protein ACJ735_16770 [Actinomycetes bacterium]
MTVTVQHRHGGDIDIAFIRGVDTPAAIEHLCRSLCAGAGFEERAIVIDLTDARRMDAIAMTPIVEATHALERDRRWLAVVNPRRPAGESRSTVHVYRSARDATAAGRRYFRLVTGVRPVRPATLAVPSVLLSVASAVPDLSRAGTAALWRGVRFWSGLLSDGLRSR